ncbi:MAG TPA: hypothetical protein VF590_18170 [Isosphaeraceae bacterium]|jgi:hypothetical protein
MKLPKLRVPFGIFLILIALIAFSIQGARIVGTALVVGLGLGHERAERAAWEDAIRLSRQGFASESTLAVQRAKYHGKMREHYSRLSRSIP